MYAAKSCDIDLVLTHPIALYRGSAGGSHGKDIKKPIVVQIILNKMRN